MVEIINISMFGISILLILNLIFLFVIAVRVLNLKGRVFDIEDNLISQIRLLKERIKALEKVLEIK